MKTSRLLLFTFMVALVSCSAEEESVLPMQAFKQIYIELQMLQSDYQSNSHKFDSKEDFQKSMDSTRQVIFDFYKTDSAAFRRSSEYYASHSDIMMTIATEVKSEMDSMDAKVRAD